ncbi:MAG: imidazoleglycerol-phosphate dehydratase HisB [Lachnospiraceae bacterium]|nr:imidazoleglycerol-phosphate dehydratase HisB [Lachnospiraceae bacterium]
MNRDNNRNYSYNRNYNNYNSRENNYNNNYGNNYNNRGYNRENREYNNDYRNRQNDRNTDRATRVVRKTNETEIFLELNLDGSGKAEIETGIGFFDHMLEGFAKHGLFDLTCRVKGDLIVDCHHTIEDTGIALGTAIRKALGYKKGIKRFGQRYLPMDETLLLCAIDLSGRPYLVFDVDFTAERVGYFDTEMVREFFYAISYAAGMNIHMKLIHGSNNHHIIEAAYKAFAKALDEAISYDARIKDIPSTKGML